MYGFMDRQSLSVEAFAVGFVRQPTVEFSGSGKIANTDCEQVSCAQFGMSVYGEFQEREQATAFWASHEPKFYAALFAGSR